MKKIFLVLINMIMFVGSALSASAVNADTNNAFWQGLKPQEGNEIVLLIALLFVLAVIAILTKKYDFNSLSELKKMKKDFYPTPDGRFGFYLSIAAVIFGIILSIIYAAWYILPAFAVYFFIIHAMIRLLCGLKSERQKILQLFRVARKDLEKAKKMADEMEITEYYRLENWRPWPQQYKAHKELYNYLLKKIIGKENKNSSVDLSQYPRGEAFEGIIGKITAEDPFADLGDLLPQFYQAAEMQIISFKEKKDFLSSLKKTQRDEDIYLNGNEKFFISIIIELLTNQIAQKI